MDAQSLTTKPPKSPLCPKDRVEKQVVAGGRNPVEVVESRHEGEHTGVDASFERREVHLAQKLLGYRRRAVFPACLRGSVPGKVLGAGRDPSRGAHVRPLKAAHHGRAHARSQIGIFSAALRDPAPARIARDVDHRGEYPVDPRLAGLLRCGRRGALHESRIERSALPQRNRKDGLVSVNHVAAENERDLQAALLDGDPLKLISLLDALGIQKRADPALSDRVDRLRRRRRLKDGKLAHLPCLLRERHPRQEVVDQRDARAGRAKVRTDFMSHRRRLLLARSRSNKDGALLHRPGRRGYFSAAMSSR